MSGFFSSGSETTTVENDPWKNMPQWMKDAYKSDIAFRDDILDEGVQIADDLAQNPQEIAGQDPYEYAGLEMGLKGVSNAQDITSGLGGYGGMHQYGKAGEALNGLGNIQGQIGKQAKDISGINVDELRSKYESDYTDDVVDTTLAGMTREAQRAQLARDAQSAAIGGTTNTRSAVADAVAGGETSRAMAEMEASLRDNAFRTAAEGGLSEAQFEVGRNETQAAIRDLAGQFGLSEANARKLLGDSRVARSDLKNNMGLDLAGFEQLSGMTGAGLLGSFGETRRGLDQAQLDADRTSGQEALGWLANIFGGTNTSKGPVGSSQTTETPTASPFQSLLGTAATAAGAFMQSDERVKEGITAASKGLEELRAVKPSNYNYKEGYGHVKGPTRGLMAQDLEHIPGAVTTAKDGVKMVDPYPVIATIVSAVQELDRRTA